MARSVFIDHQEEQQPDQIAQWDMEIKEREKQRVLSFQGD